MSKKEKKELSEESLKTRAQLLSVAKKEFLEKGYSHASLRGIAAEAGVTTGAVYFLFQDKDGLFEAVVGEALAALMQVLEKHFNEDMETDILTYQHVEGDHDDFADAITDVIYDHYDEMTILLDRATGSKYENLVDELIDRLYRNYVGIAAHYAAVVPGKRVNEPMLHYLTHVQIEAFIHMMKHMEDREQARHFIHPVMDMMIKAWIEYSLEDETVNKA